MPDLWMDVDVALSEVPVNLFPLVDDTDFKSREVAITYNQAGMDLVWNFVTTAGAASQTAVTPTTGGNYDWAHLGDGMYTIEIPASGGASINNDTEGFGWFTGYCTGVLPWRGPVIGFRAAGLNDALIDSAWSATRGLAGTALPAAAADAAGGLPISDAGALDLDTFLGRITGNVALASVLGALADAAADGDPTNADTVMQYTKQLINVLMGTAGVVSFPAAAVPGDGVSLAEVVRKIHDLLPTALVGGRMDSSVGAMAAGAINAAAIATAAITSAKFDSGAITAAGIASNAISVNQIADNAITAGKIADGAIDNATLATDLDTYQAKVVLLDDDSGAVDLYLVTFFKNGEPVASGITSPTIQVFKASDGTDLIAVGALTEIGALGMYKKSEGSNRIVAGSGYIAKTQATVGGATRTWLQPIGRDS